MKQISEMKRAHRRGKSYRQIAARFGISVATVHRLVKTDLRLLKRGRVPTRKGVPPASATQSGRTMPLFNVNPQVRMKMSRAESTNYCEVLTERKTGSQVREQIRGEISAPQAPLSLT